jgi:energy-coupling factor transporter transmembrane protein EcfT
MSGTEQHEMAERSHVYGLMICAVAILTAVTFLAGVMRRSYWALALPVTGGFLGALYVAFWIGRALIATPIEPPADD